MTKMKAMTTGQGRLTKYGQELLAESICTNGTIRFGVAGSYGYIVQISNAMEEYITSSTTRGGRFFYEYVTEALRQIKKIVDSWDGLRGRIGEHEIEFAINTSERNDILDYASEDLAKRYQLHLPVVWEDE